MKKAKEKYVTIKSFPHYGSVLVPTGKLREENGETEAECYVVYSESLPMGSPRTWWIKRSDI